MSRNVDIVFTDLDGTLLTTEKEVSRRTLALFRGLQERGISRVIATGRSYFSLQKVITRDFPADYLIVSSGAGIVEARSRRLLFSKPFTGEDIHIIARRMLSHGLDFMVHHEVPENHCFMYHQSSDYNPDFRRRLEAYRGYANPLNCIAALPERSAQIIAILPEDPSFFERIKAFFTGYQVIRATSPLDHRSIWMEVYPSGISKGGAARWLCDYLHLEVARTMGIGNDYNDIDLLDFTGLSYVVANAPAELRKKYLLTLSNDEHGVYHAIREHAGESQVTGVCRSI